MSQGKRCGSCAHWEGEKNIPIAFRRGGKVDYILVARCLELRQEHHDLVGHSFSCSFWYPEDSGNKCKPGKDAQAKT